MNKPVNKNTTTDKETPQKSNGNRFNTTVKKPTSLQAPKKVAPNAHGKNAELEL